MSVYCLHWTRDDAPADAGAVARGYARLAPRSQAAPEALSGSGFAACVGATRGAAYAHDPALTLLWDGRLVRRAELAGELGEAPSSSDAELVLAAWRRHGAAALDRLRGSFALAVLDRRERRLWLARDPLGERALYHRLEPRSVWVASEALAVLEAAGSEAEPDPAAVAAYFALRAPADARSHLRGVRELRPGEVLAVEARTQRQARIDWHWGRSWRREADDAAYAEALYASVTEALVDAAGDAVHPALSLSGGVDSTLLAAVAAGAGLAPRTHLVGWSLPATPESDERAWIEAVAASAPFADLQLIDGDDCWPLAGWPRWPSDANLPVANPYRALKQALGRRAAGAGVDVLLSGHYGDHGYPDAVDWLRGALGARRYGAAMRELGARRRSAGWRGLLRDPGVRGLWRGRSTARAHLPSWLGAEAHAALEGWSGWPPGVDDHPNAAVARALLGFESAQDAAHERHFSDRLGIEIRYPYRDPRVIDLLLSLPPDLHHRGGVPKALARLALRGRVPEAVRLRPKSGSLAALFRRGVRVQARALVEALLWHAEARWPAYVRREALERAWHRPATGESDDLLVWLAISHELWWRGLAGKTAVLAFPA